MRKNKSSKAAILLILCLILFAGMAGVSHYSVNAEEYEYDALNRVKKVTYEDGSYVLYFYDKNGNITAVRTYPATTKLPETTTEKRTDRETSVTTR